MEIIPDDSDTDDDSKFPIGPIWSTMTESYDMGGQLFDEVIIMDNQISAAGNTNTTSAAGNNNTTSAGNRAGPSQEIGWRVDELYK